MTTRNKVELFSPEYWKAWKERSNVGPAVDPAAEARKRAAAKKLREDRIQVLNKRGYTYSHPNKGWISGEGADGEPNSMLADALAGGDKTPLDYRPENDRPNMVDLVGHNGDGVVGPFRSTYLGGPRVPRTTLFGKSTRTANNMSQRTDVPFVKAPTNFGSKKQASSLFRTAPGMSFGSGTQHGSPIIKGTTGPGVIKVKKSKVGGLFSGGGGIATTSIRAKGLGEPGPGASPNETLIRPKVNVPILGRTSRWGTAAALEKHNKKTDAMYDLPSIMGASTTTPTVYKSRAVQFGGTLKDQLETSIRNGGVDTTAQQSDLDPTLKDFKEFGYGCNLEEHIKYGCCLDGGCSTRSTWEQANSQRVTGKKERTVQKRRKLRKKSKSLTSFRRSGTADSRGSRGSRGTKGTKGTYGSRRSGYSQQTWGNNSNNAGSRGVSRSENIQTPVSISTSLASARAKPGAVWGETPIHLATRSGEPKKLQHLLAGIAVWSPKERRMVRKGRDINVVDSQNRTPLHTACYDGNIPMVKVLLDAEPKAKLDIQDFEGNTPLHLAMIKGEDYVAKLLIGAGCDPDLQNHHGMMPYNLATSHRAYQFAKEASMLVDTRMKTILTQKKYMELLERKRKEEAEKAAEEDRLNFQALHITGKSVYASIVRQLQAICSTQRRLFGAVIEDIEDLFDAIDVNGDGNLSIDEIQKGLRRLDLGLTHEQVEELVMETDVDGNREIDREEFMSGIIRFAQL